MNLREKLIDLSNQRTTALEDANRAMEAGNTGTVPYSKRMRPTFFRTRSQLL